MIAMSEPPRALFEPVTFEGLPGFPLTVEVESVASVENTVVGSVTVEAVGSVTVEAVGSVTVGAVGSTVGPVGSTVGAVLSEVADARGVPVPSVTVGPTVTPSRVGDGVGGCVVDMVGLSDTAEDETVLNTVAPTFTASGADDEWSCSTIIANTLSSTLLSGVNITVTMGRSLSEISMSDCVNTTPAFDEKRSINASTSADVNWVF